MPNGIWKEIKRQLISHRCTQIDTDGGSLVLEEERDDLSERIIGASFRVQNSLGTGFLEKVYRKALVVELSKNGLTVEE